MMLATYNAVLQHATKKYHHLRLEVYKVLDRVVHQGRMSKERNKDGSSIDYICAFMVST